MLERKINDLLLLAADPGNEHKLETIDYIAIKKDLESKFKEGYSFLESFRTDCINTYSYGERFMHIEIDNMFQLLEIMLNSRPNQLVQRLQKFYRIYHRNNKKEEEIDTSGLSDEDARIVKLAHYTHRWRQEIEKKPRNKYTSFDHLKGITPKRADLYLTQKMGDHYRLHAIFQRVKRKNTIINKMLGRIMEEKKEVKRNKNNGREFNPENCYVEDYFGMKIICPSWSNKGILNGFLAYKPNSIWLFNDAIDHRSDPNKDINHIKYYFHKKYRTDVPLELQFTTLVDYFLDEFFHKDNHLRYESQKEAQRKKYRRRKDYKQMETKLNNVLSFLD